MLLANSFPKAQRSSNAVLVKRSAPFFNLSAPRFSFVDKIATNVKNVYQDIALKSCSVFRASYIIYLDIQLVV